MNDNTTTLKEVDINGRQRISDDDRPVYDPKHPMTLDVFRVDADRHLCFDRDGNSDFTPVPFSNLSCVVDLLYNLEYKWVDLRDSVARKFEGVEGNKIGLHWDAKVSGDSWDYEDMPIMNREVYELFHTVGFHVSEIVKSPEISKEAQKILDDADSNKSRKLSSNLKSILSGRYSDVSLEMPLSDKNVGSGTAATTEELGR